MAASAMMSGPDGTEVRCYRRGARQVTAGDYLTEHGAHAATDALQDPDDGSWWVTLTTGADINLTPRGKVWMYRTYDAPVWMSDALEAYRGARDTRDNLRESGAVVPTSVAGAAGSGVAVCQLEDDDFRTAFPAPRLADFIREAARSHRTARELATA